MRPTLFEFAGGDPALLALAAAHHERCLSDPEVNHPFSHSDQNPDHVQRLYGSPDAVVADAMEIPRWGWDGLQAEAQTVTP